MKLSKAYRIFEEINSPEYSDCEKFDAITQVLGMVTHNSVTKTKIVEAFRWVLEHINQDDKILKNGTEESK